MATTTTQKPYAVLQINGQGIQQGTPGEVRVYEECDTFEQAEAEMNRLSETHDDNIYLFDVAELIDGEYKKVEW